MSKKFFSILFAALIQCLLPLAHADSTNAGSTDITTVGNTNIDVRADILYTGENAGNSILPHFLDSPGFGGKLSIENSTGTVDWNIALSSMQSNAPAHMQDGKNDLLHGHTGVSLGVGGEIGIARISAQQSYMHTDKGSVDFFQGDRYETLLKAGFASLVDSAQKPYLLAGLIVPAYVPVEEIIGMGGFGFVTHTPVYNGIAWSVGIHTDSSIATSLLNINHEQETVVQSRVAMQTQIQNSPLKIDLGFNFFQDVQRKEYKTWWDFNLSYLF